MKIKYEFADGTVSEVEVEESIGAVIIEDRRVEDNLSRKERYHCYSLEAAEFEGKDYADGTTPEADLMEKEFCREMQEVLEGLTDILRRKNLGRSHNCCSPFSAKLKCGDCGEYFGSKVWHSNSKYRRTVWQCNAKFKGESKCATPHLYEQRIKELFLEAFGILMENREEIIGDCRAVMEALADCSAINVELEAVSSEMEVTAGLIQKLVDENATRKLDQHDYRKKYDGYANRYAALESRMDSLEKERERKGIQYDIFSGFLAGLSETEELPVDFNEKLFHRLVDFATVYSDGRVVFTFRNGVEVRTEI